MRVFAILALAALAAVQDKPRKGQLTRPFAPTDRYEKRDVEGWTVHVNRDLAEAEAGRRALRVLEMKLFEIVLTVPERACAELRKVPIWLSVREGTGAGAEYHPSREWLAEHGHNPDKAKAVEIGDAEALPRWVVRQPSVILHELAHAYHDRVLGFDHAGIRAAYRAAVEGKKYESVLHAGGKPTRHYALTNEKEYFAEASEAWFGTNDFYPFVRAELREHDPGACAVLQEVWGR